MNVSMSIPHPAFLAMDHFSDHSADRRLSTVLEESSLIRPKNEPQNATSPDTDDNPSKRQKTGYECAPCNMTFTEKRALARHRKTDHHRRQIGLPPDRRHACCVCGKHFTRGHDLKRHQNEQHTDYVSPGAELLSGVSEYSTAPSRIRTHGAASADDTVYIPATTDASSTHMQPSPRGTIPFGSPVACAGFEDVANDPSHRSHMGATHTFYADSVLDGASFAAKHQVPALSSLPDLMETDHTDTSEGSPASYRSLTSQGSDTAKSPDTHSQMSVSDPATPRLPADEVQRHFPTFSRTINADSCQPLMCVVCGIPFEDDPEELVVHLRRHLDPCRGSHQCTECLIGFTHEEDLERHLQCAAEGHCGFSFPHTEPCTGHHPPRNDSGAARLSDNDRASLCNRLDHWEQAQLRAYMSEIDAVFAQHSSLTQRRASRNPRWSDVIGRPISRRNSQSSFAISVKTFASAPCDGIEGKMDIGGLQKRMQQMSLLGNAKTRVSRMIRNGPTSAQDTINKSLRKAVKYGQLTKISQYLDAGGDPSIVQEEAPLIAAVLWGPGYVSERMAEHRLDEDIMGKCSKCGFKSSAFDDNPSNKIKALLRHNAEPNRQGGLCDYPLVTAAWLGRPDLVKMLLDRDANVDLHASKYGTALCAAASQAGDANHSHVINLLLEHGADPQVRHSKGTAREIVKHRLELRMLQIDTESGDPEGDAAVAYCQQAVFALEKAEAAPPQLLPRSAATKKRLRTVASEPALDIHAGWEA